MLYLRIRPFTPLTRRWSRLTHRRPRFSSSPFRPQSSFWHTRSFSRIVVAFHPRIRKFRFFFLAESRYNDFNLKRTPSWPFRSSPFLPFDFTQCMNIARELTLNLRSSILGRWNACRGWLSGRKKEREKGNHWRRAVKAAFSFKLNTIRSRCA